MSTPEPTSNLAVPNQLPVEVAHFNHVKNLPGYTTPVFKGKEEQRTLVERDVAAKVLSRLDRFDDR